MKKQLRHVVIYFFINISVILNFWPAILSKIKETKKLSGNTSCIADIFANELEISGVVVQRIHQSSSKKIVEKKLLLREMTFRLF